MPTSKSSTSSDDFQRAIFEKKAAEGDYLFLLNELLAVCHRDGGHYTALAGHAVSVQDAMRLIPELFSARTELARSRRRIK